MIESGKDRVEWRERKVQKQIVQNDSRHREGFEPNARNLEYLDQCDEFSGGRH